VDSRGDGRVQAEGAARVRFGECFPVPGTLSDRYWLVVARESYIAQLFENRRFVTYRGEHCRLGYAGASGDLVNGCGRVALSGK
jgi:hypothetical protein